MPACLHMDKSDAGSPRTPLVRALPERSAVRSRKRTVMHLVLCGYIRNHIKSQMLIEMLLAKWGIHEETVLSQVNRTTFLRGREAYFFFFFLRTVGWRQVQFSHVCKVDRSEEKVFVSHQARTLGTPRSAGDAQARLQLSPLSSILRSGLAAIMTESWGQVKIKFTWKWDWVKIETKNHKILFKSMALRQLPALHQW